MVFPLFREKRGVSEIIATVLTILFVILAVALLAFFVLKFVRSSSELMELGLSTIDIEIKDDSVILNESEKVFSAVVMRNVGQGNLSGVRFVLFFENSSNSIIMDKNLLENEAGHFVVYYGGFEIEEKLISIGIAPVVQTKRGKLHTGNILDTYVFTGEEIKEVQIRDDSIIGGNDGSGGGSGSGGDSGNDNDEEEPIQEEDNIFPIVAILSPTNLTYNNSIQRINISATDNIGISRVWYNWNGTNLTYTEPLDVNFTNGSITLMVWANDTSGNVVNSSVRFIINVTLIIDTLMPSFTSIPPNSTITYGSNWNGVQFTAFDNSGVVLYLVNNTNFEINSTGFLKLNNNISAGIYDLNVSIIDSSNNYNSTNYKLTINKKDLSVIGENKTKIYGTSDSIFTAVYSGFIVGENQSNLGGNLVFNRVSGEGVGIYAITPSGLTSNNYNLLFVNGFLTINKATPTGTIMGTSQINYGTAANIQGTTTNTGNADAQYRLYRNNILVSNPDISVLAAGTYNYIYNVTAGTNYTASSSLSTFQLVVSNILSDIDLVVNNSRSNIQIEFGSTIPLNLSTTNGDLFGIIQLLLNGVLINQGNSKISNMTNFNNLGNFNVTGIYVDSQNYTQTSKTFFVNVVDNVKPYFTTIPTNLTKNFGESVGVQFVANDNAALQSYTLGNWTDKFMINSSGYLRNTSALNLGTYQINITIHDTSGNSNTTWYKIVVLDSISPTIIIYSPLNTTYNNSIQRINISATDNIGISRVWYNWNGTNLTYTAPININFTNGSRFLRIWANDTSGNVVNTSVAFVINLSTQDVAPPYFIQYPILYSINHGQSLGYQLIALDNVAVDSFTINWTNTFLINRTGYLRNNSALSAGTYNLNVTVNDTSGNRNSTIFVLTVLPSSNFVERLSSQGSVLASYSTIQACSNAATAGQTCLVYPGNYAERVTISNSGSSGSPIIFKAFGSGVKNYGFTLNGKNYIEINGFEISIPRLASWDVWGTGTGIWLRNSDYNLLVNNIINGTLREGISFDSGGSGSSDYNYLLNNTISYAGAYAGMIVLGTGNIIDRNEISHTIQHPLYPNLSAVGSPDADGVKFGGIGNIFTGNYIHSITINDYGNIDPHVDAFQASGFGYTGGVVSNIVFEKNFIDLSNSGTYTQGIYSDDGNLANITIRNNIIQVCQPLNLWYDSGVGPIIVSNTIRSISCPSSRCDGTKCDGIQLGQSPNAIIQNNMFYYLRSYLNTLDSDSRIGLNVSNNGYYIAGNSNAGPVGYGSNPVNSDPKFVNVTIYDYRLQSNSPMIDKGLNLSIYGVLDDKDGVSRLRGSAYDIGAYEY